MSGAGVEEGIPLETIGMFGSKRVLQDCAKWRSMRVGQLREECDLRNLATADLSIYRAADGQLFI